jgi:hypothetical protein
MRGAVAALALHSGQTSVNLTGAVPSCAFLRVFLVGEKKLFVSPLLVLDSVFFLQENTSLASWVCLWCCS